MTTTPAPTIKATPWQVLRDYLGGQIDADDKVHRGFLESGDHLRAASFGGLLAANRNTLAKVTEMERAAAGCRVADQILPWPEVQEGDLAASQPSTPDCRVVDMIVHADQVRVGDLMLTCGVLASVALIEIDLSQAARVHITAHHASLPTGEVSIWRQRHLLVAVRRYQEG